MISSNSILTSPVFDDATSNLFIGAGNGNVYSIPADDASTGPTPLAVGTTGALNSAVRDTPIVGSSAGTLFAISSHDSTTLNSAVVVQASTSPFAEINRVSVGMGSTGTPGTSVNLYGGDFDNTYFTDPANGHMLVCGTDPLHYRGYYNHDGGPSEGWHQRNYP